MAERPAPTATGDLATTPLAHVLVYARNRRLTGELEVRAPGRQAAMTFWRGRITRAEAAPSPCYFGSVAYEMGVIDAATLDATLLEVAKGDRMHGEILLARGAITAETRDRVLVEQACRKVHHVFTFPADASFAFYETRPGAEEPALALDPLAPMWRGIRDFPPTASIREVLLRYAGARLALVNEAPLTRIGLDADERDLVVRLSAGALSVDELAAGSTLGRARVELFAYMLFISKCAEPHGVAPRTVPPATALATAGSGAFYRRPPSFRVPSVPRTAVSSPPRAALAAPPPVRHLGPVELGVDGIAIRALGLDMESYFAILELPEAAPPEAVRAAFFRLARAWHPDRLPPELASARDEARAVYEQMALAHRTLTDPQLRARYLATLRPTSARSREQALRDIELALERHDYLAAEAEARALCESSPDDAVALSLLGWALAWAGDGPDDALRAGMRIVDRAIALDRQCDRAYVHRGLLQRRLGDAEAAYRDFARALQANPRNTIAEREVRVHELRTRARRP